MGGNSRPSMALVLSIQRHKVICKNSWFTRTLSMALPVYLCMGIYSSFAQTFWMWICITQLKVVDQFSFFLKDYFWGVLAYMVSCGPKEEGNQIFKIKRVFLNAWKEFLWDKSKHWTSSSCFPDHLFMLCIIGLLIGRVGYSNVLL